MKKRSTLERQMLGYFGLIAAASLLITVEFVWALQKAMYELAGSEGGALAIVGGLRNKAFLMCVVQVVVTLIVLVMLIRRITGPLQHMAERAAAICEGDLSVSIVVVRKDEIGLLGETINGLTSNIQEIVALGLSANSTVLSSLEQLRPRMSHDPFAKKLLEEVEQQEAEFRSVLESFTLLAAPSTGEKGTGAQ